MTETSLLVEDRFLLEKREMGIGHASLAWRAAGLLLHYSRARQLFYSLILLKGFERFV
jgi:hypothetical protein